MAEVTGTIERLANELASALAALEEVAQPANLTVLLRELGADAPPDVSGDAQLAQDLGAVVTCAVDLGGRIEALAVAAEEENALAAAAAGVALLSQCASIGAALDRVATRLNALLAGTPAAAVAAGFAELVIGDVIARYLEASFPLLRRVLTLMTVIERDTVTLQVAGRPVEVLRRRFRFERLPRMLSDPLGLLESGYGWGRADFDAPRLLRRIGELFEPLDPIAVFGDEVDPAAAPILDFGALTLKPAATAPPGLTGELHVDLSADTSITLAELADDWRLVLGLGGSFREGLAVTILPPTRLELQPPAGTLEGRVGLEIIGASSDPERRLQLFGLAGSVRVEAESVSAGVVGMLSWNNGTGRADADVGIRAKIAGGRIIIGAPDGDGLLSSVLPEGGIEAPFDLAVSWTRATGLRFEGGAGLELRLPVNLALGPIAISSITIGASIDAAKLALGAGATVGFALGPIAAVVEGLGIKLDVDFGERGSLGNADLGVRFKAPTGIGLSLETPAVRLAGFLSIDPERGRYVGAVELRLFEKLDLSAICIITTKLPDGTEGFSLLVVIGLTFPVPIPLGYNFYLTGVGGVLGINRGFDTGKLREGLQSGILDRVLFPQNVLGDIDRVVADLDAVFPISPHGFLLGPTVTIQWSQPALLTAKLALVLSFDKSFRAAIAGVVRLALPTPDKAILQLQAAFLGTIDFDVGMLSFDASIYDSFFGVGDFKIWIEGDVALRISWGKQKDFVLTVGGFHPAFKPPTHLQLPALKRVTLSVMRGNPRLTLTAYFALTTNTVQFGARAELYIGLGPLEVLGALGFDALFQFNPFRFALSIEVMLSVRFAGLDLLGVEVRLQLEGPTPWYAKGVACLRILFFEVCAEFETRFGQVVEQPRETIALLPILTAELAKPSSWLVSDTREASALVTRRALAKAGGPDDFVLETAGRISVRQNVVPFERGIEVFGQQDPSDVSRFAVDRLTVAGAGVPVAAATEPFAPSMFKRMSDRDKLSAPSYEAMPSGIEATVTGEGFSVGAQIRRRRFEYEVAISDGDRQGTGAPEGGSADELARLLEGSAAARSPLGKARRRASEEGAIAELGVGEESFAIVTVANDVVIRRLPRSEAASMLEELTATGGAAFAMSGKLVTVATVVPGTPAAAGGLQAGDVIVTIDGAAVAAVTDARRLAAAPGGREVTYVVRRSGADRTIKVMGARDRSSLIVVPDALAA